MIEVDENVQQHLQIFGASLFLSIFILTLSWKLNYFRLPEKEAGRSLTLQNLIGIFLVFLSVQLILLPLIAMVGMSIIEGRWVGMHVATTDPILLGWFDVTAITSSAFAMGLYLLMTRETAFKIALGRKGLKGGSQLLTDLGIGMLSWPLGYSIMLTVGQLASVLVLLLLPGKRDEQVAVKHLKMTMESPLLFFTLAAAIVFVVPIVEEVLFRGFLQNWFKNYFNRLGSILLASLIFAFFHFSYSQGIDNIEVITSLFVFSCFLGFVYERQQSLWASVGLHALFNAISVVLIVLETRV